MDVLAGLVLLSLISADVWRLWSQERRRTSQDLTIRRRGGGHRCAGSKFGESRTPVPAPSVHPCIVDLAGMASARSSHLTKGPTKSSAISLSAIHRQL